MTKKETYEEVIPQIRSLISGETDEISVMANVAAVLHTTFDEFFWTGFYLVREGELRLGPFQGPLACMHIQYGRGVCGTAWKEAQTQVVPDVELWLPCWISTVNNWLHSTISTASTWSSCVLLFPASCIKNRKEKEYFSLSFCDFRIKCLHL